MSKEEEDRSELYSSTAPVEPNAEARVAAKALREMYLSLLAEGFTEKQGLIIIGQIIAAGSSDDGDDE